MTLANRTRPSGAWSRAILPVAVAVALVACGGGGNTRPTPPPPTPPPPTGIGFTPTVANDASLVVNPPSVPALAAPRALADNSLNKHLILTNAAGALGAGLTGSGVTIGLLDSGVNRNHPTLAGRVTRNFINVSSGSNNTSVDDVVGHGTTVASIAAGNPATGVYHNADGTYSTNTGLWGGGVAQGATIVSSRIIADKPPEDDGSGEGNEILAGEGYGDYFRQLNAQLADAGAKIINNSWGGLYWNDPALTTELANAWKDFVVNRGGIIVFANGNSGDDPRYVGEPSDNAMLPTLANDRALERGWFTVGALDPANPTQLTDYSQQCGGAMNYCLVAPGDVTFIDPKATSQANSGFFRGGGTSYAAPQVAGAAAVVWAAFPYFTNDLVRQTVLAASKDLGAPGVDPVFGWGLLDVTKAAMGPSYFHRDWGNFDVTVTGNSVWRNEIKGDFASSSPGLIKRGSGVLTITETPRYHGATRVMEGGLYLAKGSFYSTSVRVDAGATLWVGSNLDTRMVDFPGGGVEQVGGLVTNHGNLFLKAVPSTPTYYPQPEVFNRIEFTGNYLQSATGNLGLWLGMPLHIRGTATIAGQMSILGVKSGYTTTAKETLLNAAGGITGTFSSLKAAPNVFLDATLSYDPNNVFLNINRIDVSKAVAGMGLGGITAMSATRMEAAMQAIDQQLAGGGDGGISTGLIDAAGALQQSWSVANADYSLRSLSGELHAASAAMTFDALDAGRRAMDGRIASLARSRATGGWQRNLASSGTLAQSGFDSIGVDASGRMIGNDWRVGDDAVVGIAMNRLEQSSWLGAFGDRSRGLQSEVQLYGAAWRGRWQAQGQLVSGRFDRQMQRNLLLGGLRDGVASQLSGRYQGVHGEIGRRFEPGAVELVPYLGGQYVQLSDDGFDEGGTTGFGLRADAWKASRWQAFGGLRAERGWRLGGLDLRANARAEWQRTLAADGFAFDASYTGLEQWAPLQGIGLSERSQLFGAGLSAVQGDSTFRFDLSRRASSVGDNTQATLQFLRRF